MTLRNELSVNLGLPSAPITQNGELYSELSRVYSAIRSVARSLDIYTGAVNEEESYWSQTKFSRCLIGLNSRIYLEAGEDINAGFLVGVKSDGKAWKALEGTIHCIGFCTANVTTGNTAEIQLLGIYPSLPAATLTPGSLYYCSNATAGTIAATGTKAIGIALSDTTLYFNPQL